MVQTLVPDATLTPSDWILGAGASKHAAVASDDADAGYIRTLTGLSQTQAFGLPAATDPVIHTGHQLVVVYRRVLAVVQAGVRVGIQLYQGATPITGVERSDPATDSYATFTYTLSSAEAAAITDYGALRLYVSGPSAAITGFELRVTYAALIVPDVSEALVAWTLAEGACDAVGAALLAGLNAKLTAVEARYGDGITLGQISEVWRSPVSFDGPLEHWPAIGVWADSGSAATMNAGGHGRVSFNVRVVCAVSGQADADVVERQSQRLALAALETLRDAYVGGTLVAWDLMAATPQISYTSREFTNTTWTREAHISLTLSKVEAI